MLYFLFNYCMCIDWIWNFLFTHHVCDIFLNSLTSLIASKWLILNLRATTISYENNDSCLFPILIPSNIFFLVLFDCIGGWREW